MINTGHHHIRFFVEQTGNSEVHTVRGRSVDKVHASVCPAYPQWRIQCERMTRAALIAVRRHDDQTGERVEMPSKRSQTGGMVAVIITKQDFHREGAITVASKDGKHSNSDDAALFRDALGDVAPLKGKKRHEGGGRKPTARAIQRRRDERRVLDESLEDVPDGVDVATGEELRFSRPHIARTTLRNLRRGRIAVQCETDLHGMTQDEAREHLREFIEYSLHKGFRCVRVVHGKGLGSGPRGPVLKNGVNNWLRRWDTVLAFCSAPDHDGGTGAVYVLLRSG